MFFVGAGCILDAIAKFLDSFKGLVLNIVDEAFRVLATDIVIFKGLLNFSDHFKKIPFTPQSLDPNFFCNC